MERGELSGALDRAYRTEPIAAVIVPEADLAAFVWTVREALFNEVDGRLSRAMLDDLHRISEPFADMLDLERAKAAREGIRDALDHVRAWLDAGCITLPPVHHIRTLVGALA